MLEMYLFYLLLELCVHTFSSGCIEYVIFIVFRDVIIGVYIICFCVLPRLGGSKSNVDDFLLIDAGMHINCRSRRQYVCIRFLFVVRVFFGVAV
jgi:hypothetical protein